ncbi:MAG: hypothetical protein H0U65_01810 [Rubrobacter sp.]|nr:hypothetical protein [Rubrobacter sp.]
MRVPFVSRPTDHRTGTGASERKVLAFTAAVFVVSTAAVASLLLYLGQGAFASFLAGFFVGATAAVEVGWFGGHALFSKDGDA